MRLIISSTIREKLTAKHGVTEQDVIECFANRDRTSLVDDREDHQSDPATQWFISETFYARKLLIAYIPREDGIHIRSAFAPNAAREAVYLAKSKMLFPEFDDK